MTYLKKQRGFTLVELLVVIAIIGLLMGLLIVGLTRARGSRDLASCTNKQRQIGLAIQQYVTSKGNVPGYVNTNDRSWVVQILPNLGELQRYEDILRLEKGSATVSESEIYAELAHLICPAQTDFYYQAPDDNYPSLSYVGNCGYWYGDKSTETATDSGLRFGIFTDRSGSGTKKKVTLDNLKDGTSNTILVSENRNAGSWRLEPASVSPNANDNKGWLGSVGFRWDSPSSTGSEISNLRPNSLSQEQLDGFVPWDAARHYEYARPSSEHAGVVVILKADGSVDTLSDSIEDDVYVSLCCPDDSAAKKTIDKP